MAGHPAETLLELDHLSPRGNPGFSARLDSKWGNLSCRGAFLFHFAFDGAPGRGDGGDRVALTFDGTAIDVAQVMLIYFPGSRASMKDKQYYEDMASELLRIEQRNRANSQVGK